MEATAKRPWYRLHWGTVLTVFFVGLAWVHNGYINVIPPDDTAQSGGWPFVSIWTDGEGVSEVHIAAMTFDTALMVGCLSSVAIVVERMGWVRFQFGLASLLSGVTGVAAALAAWSWNRTWRRLEFTEQAEFVVPGLGAYQTIDSFWWEAYIPMFFGIGCATSVGVWVVLRCAVWPIARLRRPAPVKVEADGSPAQ